MRAYGTVGTGTGTAGPLDLPLTPTRYRDQLAEPRRLPRRRQANQP